MKYSWYWLVLVLLMPIAWLMIPLLFIAVVAGALHLLVHEAIIQKELKKA